MVSIPVRNQNLKEALRNLLPNRRRTTNSNAFSGGAWSGRAFRFVHNECGAGSLKETPLTLILDIMRDFIRSGTPCLIQ